MRMQVGQERNSEGGVAEAQCLGETRGWLWIHRS